MLSEAHDVEQHRGALVVRVVHDFLDEQRIDALEDRRHGEREHLGGPAGLDAGGVKRRTSFGTGGFQAIHHAPAHALRIDQRGDRGRHDVLARREQPADVVECAGRIHFAEGHVQHAIGVEGQDLLGVSGRRHADPADPADVTDVTAGLGVAVDIRADQLELGVAVHGSHRVPTYGPSGPLDDAKHDLPQQPTADGLLVHCADSRHQRTLALTRRGAPMPSRRRAVRSASRLWAATCSGASGSKSPGGSRGASAET